MTDETMLTRFEQRLSSEFERIVAGATDPKPAAEIADAAMRPRSAVTRARNSSSGRRLLLLGLAAVLLIPAAYLGALRVLPTQNDSTFPKPSFLAVALSPPPTNVSTNAPNADLHHAVVLREAAGSSTGLDVYEVRPDGYERFVRNVPDSIFGSGTVGTDYTTVRADGWLALGDQQKPWPMALVDLADESTDPWIVGDASLGGIAPVWGPTGLIATAGSSQIGGSGHADAVVFADPNTRTSQKQLILGAMIGGGPSIIWTEDGGILSERSDGTYATAHTDGSISAPGFPKLDDPSRVIGPGGSHLEVCDTDSTCDSSQLGNVRSVGLDGSISVIYEPAPGYRVVGAQFGRQDGEYWILNVPLDRREYQLVKVDGSGKHVVATIDGAATWQGVYPGPATREEDMYSLFIDSGGVFGTVLIDTASGASSYHSGRLAGFVSGNALTNQNPTQLFQQGLDSAQPNGGQTSTLPTVDQMIAAEMALNPGRVVLGKGARDGVLGDTALYDYKFTVDSAGGTSDVYFDCIGSASATVSVSSMTNENPCLRAGSYISQASLSGHDVVTVHASGDTTWRVEIYSSYTTVGPGASPAPMAAPSP